MTLTSDNAVVKSRPIGDATEIAPPPITEAQHQRIRLLVVSEPGSAGVRRHVCHLLDHLDIDRFDVTFVYSLARADKTYASDIRGFERKGIRCLEIPMQRNIVPRGDAAALWSLWRLIRQWQPEIVHCHSAKAGFLARAAARLSLRGATTVYTPNAMPCYFSKKYESLERMAGRWTDWLIAVSESECDDFKAWRIVAPERMRVIPMAVEPIPIEVECRIADCRGQRAAAEIVVGACGRICHQKRAKFFFEVGLQLLEVMPTLKLKWIGDFSDDDEAASVRELIAQTPNRDRIEVTGWIDNPLEQLGQLDLFCMFSRYESFGFVTAEAMQLGVPVIALDATGTRDLVLHDKTGLICEPSASAAAEAALVLLRDSNKRSLLAGEAKQMIQSLYSPKMANGKLHQFYEQIATTLRA